MTAWKRHEIEEVPSHYTAVRYPSKQAADIARCQHDVHVVFDNEVVALCSLHIDNQLRCGDFDCAVWTEKEESARKGRPSIASLGICDDSIL